MVEGNPQQERVTARPRHSYASDAQTGLYPREPCGLRAATYETGLERDEVAACPGCERKPDGESCTLPHKARERRT